MSKAALQNFLHKNLKFILAGTILLIAFYAFSFFLVKGGGLNRFDFDMTVRIQNNIPIRVDPYFSILSLLGSFEVTLGILIILALIIRKMGMIFVIGMFCIMHVVELVGKAYLDHPATPFMFHRYALDFMFPTGYVQPGGSYPSGHAMRISFLTVLFIYLIAKSKFKKELKYCLYFLIVGFYIVMCVSRVSLGEHWTSDVIGGSLLGAAFAFFSVIFI